VTAFAAVLPRRAARPAGIPEVAAALSAVYDTRCEAVALDGCVLLSAPVSPSEPTNRMFSDTAAGITVVGQVLLEDRRALSAALQLPDDVESLRLAAAVYARWGESGTERLSGEFALSLWDARRRSLVCARDGLGVRPLFVATGPDVVVVTNMLSAARAHPCVSQDPDDRSLAGFLAKGEMPEGRTAYRAIVPLPPGHTLTIPQQREASLRRHWWFPSADAPPRRDPAAVVEGYRSVLQQAVADRLSPQTAILMSGGVDSTTIAAAARTAAPDVALLAVTADYQRVPAASELARARIAARALGIPIVAVPGDAHAALSHLATGRPTPQPVDEPSLEDWRALIGRAAAHGTVALYGEDGDSLFLPPAWQPLRRAESLASLTGDVVRFIAAKRRMPYIGLRLRERVGLARHPSPPAPPRWLSAKARQLQTGDEPPLVLGRSTTPLPAHETRPEAQNRLCRGVAGYLSGILTPEVTGHRLELRCPLLDTRVVRFVMNVPSIPWCQRKHLPREAYADVLPGPIVTAPKRGVAGIDAMLARDWQQRRAGLPDFTVPEVLADLIVTGEWRRALLGSDVLTVGPAWRVLELDAWLTGERQTAVLQERRV
jgi:asparagine synthase (glutamine-hydrolysing)